MRKQYNPNLEVLSTALTRAVKQGSSASWFAPLVKGDMDVDTWLRWVDKENVTRKDGTTYPAVYSVMGSGSYAVSQVTRMLWAANQAGLLPYTQAVHQGEAFRGLVESVTHSFAAKLGRAVPEVTAGTLRIRTRSEEASATRDIVAEVREAAAHFRAEHDAGRLTQAEYVARMQELNDELREYRWSREMQGNAVMDSDSGNPAEDEGSIEAAVHRVSDLWSYDAKDVLGAERTMVEAIHAFTGLDLPINDPEWDWVTERLAESWALAQGYAKDRAEREDLERKIGYRAAVAEHGITAEPGKARWAVNHIARRIWRDRVMLKQRVDNWEARIGRTGERMAAEEKYNLPAIMTRIIGEQPSMENEDGTPRTHYLVWDVVEEASIAPAIEYHDGDGFKRLSQGEYDILLSQALIERAEAILAKMDRLYAKVRAVDEALAPVWAKLHDPEADVVMPEHPPVYWNAKGFYLTEEEAMAAIAAEQEERREKTLDGIGELLKQMLAAQGWMK